MSLHVLDLRTGHQRLLVDDATGGLYLPAGQLLYVRRDGTALVAPFDLDKLAITGPAVPVLEGVMVSNGAAQPDRLAHGRAGIHAGSRRRQRGPAGSGDPRGRGVPDRHGLARAASTRFALSPDGRRVAVGVGLVAGKLDIWIKQLDRGPFTRLTFGGQNRRPAWSPDGRTVGVHPRLGHHQRRLSAAGRRQHAAAAARAAGPAGPGGHLVAGRALAADEDRQRHGRPGDIVGVRTSGDTTPVPLVEDHFTELHAGRLARRTWLAYTSNESGAQEVYVPVVSRDDRRAMAGVQRWRDTAALVI